MKLQASGTVVNDSSQKCLMSSLEAVWKIHLQKISFKNKNAAYWSIGGGLITMQIAFCRNNKPSVRSFLTPPDWMHFCLVKGFVFRSAAYENIVQGFLSSCQWILARSTLHTLQSDNFLCTVWKMVWRERPKLQKQKNAIKTQRNYPIDLQMAFFPRRRSRVQPGGEASGC